VAPSAAWREPRARPHYPTPQATGLIPPGLAEQLQRHVNGDLSLRELLDEGAKVASLYLASPEQGSCQVEDALLPDKESVVV
jgi:hypothetical protein